MAPGSCHRARRRRIELDGDGEVRPQGLTHALVDLDEEAHAPLEGTAALVGAAVVHRGEELADEIAVGGEDGI